MRRVRLVPFSLLVGALCLLPQVLSADVLMLKDGQAITGRYQGGDQNSVSFLVDGRLRKYSVSEVNSVTFSPTPAVSSSAPVTSEVPAYSSGRNTTSTTTPSTSSSSVTTSSTINSSSVSSTPASRSTLGITIPAGTLLTVRMIDPIDSSINAVGETFRASLDEPLVINGRTVASRGANVTAKLTEVESAGRIAGRSELSLILLDMIIDGRRYEVTTSEVSEAGASRGRQTATRAGIGAGIGAAIGAIAGGGRGAATGAAAGAGAGTAIQVFTHGEQVKIPAESRLVFTLQNPVYL